MIGLIILKDACKIFSAFRERLERSKMTSHKLPLFYIVDWLPPDFGAVGQYGLLFAREFAESGRHVYLIGLTTGASSLEREVYRSGGVLEINRIHTPPYNKSRNIERLLWTFKTNFRLIRAVMGNPASHNADVLFTGAPPFMLFFALALKVLRKEHLTYRITDFYPEVIIADRGKRTLVLRLLGAWRRPTTNSNSWGDSGAADISQTRPITDYDLTRQSRLPTAFGTKGANDPFILWQLWGRT
jgi:hypothetical protein